MTMRISKRWSQLTAAAIEGLPAQLGVYEIADAAGVTTKIGYAGATQPFGIRSALAAELVAGGTSFRHEFTHGYLTRWHELLMIYHADHGELPSGNADRAGRIGRLSPGASPGSAT